MLPPQDQAAVSPSRAERDDACAQLHVDHAYGGQECGCLPRCRFPAVGASWSVVDDNVAPVPSVFLSHANLNVIGREYDHPELFRVIIGTDILKDCGFTFNDPGGRGRFGLTYFPPAG